jgi:hypothetical protein
MSDTVSGVLRHKMAESGCTLILTEHLQLSKALSSALLVGLDLRHRPLPSLLLRLVVLPSSTLDRHVGFQDPSGLDVLAWTRSPKADQHAGKQPLPKWPPQHQCCR